MSAKNRLITYSYQKKKNTPSSASGRKGPSDVKPSTSNGHLEENDLKMLREFDLNWEYGPSMGITRLERWDRADSHGLNPDPAIKELVLAHKDEEQYTQCLWNDYKNIM